MATILDTVRADRFLTIEVRPFAVGAVVDEVLTRLGTVAASHRLERYTDGEPHGPRRPGAAGPGARAAARERREVRAARRDDRGCRLDRCRRESAIAVGDDGPGIPVEQRESVFEPFVRLAATDSRPGAGVGLFAARRLVGAMGGRLWIEDKPAGGTQFVTALARAESARR